MSKERQSYIAPGDGFHFFLGLANTYLPIERAPQFGGKPKEKSPLYKACEPVEITPDGLSEARVIVGQMADFMQKYYEITSIQGALAANQIGINKRIVIRNRKNPEGKFEVTPYINLTITKRSERKNVYPEPCLSLAPETHMVARAAEIEAEWYDLDGLKHQESFADSMEAVLLQHEEAHLNGITCDIDSGKIPGSEHVLESFQEYRNQKIKPAA